MKRKGTTVTILAFSEPPEHWGFKLAKSGKCWWIRLRPARVPSCLFALKAEGIRCKSLWPDDDAGPSPSPSTIKPRSRRPRGKAARLFYDEDRRRRRGNRILDKAQKTAEAILEAQAIQTAKVRRLKLDRKKYEAELASQARQRLDREQMAQAAAAASYLLRRPVGNA